MSRANINGNGTVVERADPPAGGEEPACGGGTLPGAIRRLIVPVVSPPAGGSRWAAGYGAVFARPNGVSRAGKVGCAVPRLSEVKAGAGFAIAVYAVSL
jgi:hypothetical protein